MTVRSGDLSRASQEQWLKLYYFARTAFSAVWVAAAFTVGQHSWVIAALEMSMNWVLGVFGVWAILSGLLQLGSAVRRWKSYGAQWAMILSGGQSALAGMFFIVQARMPMPPSITNVAGYAAVGALYFLVSAVWLSVSQLRRKTA
jgi:uncharacterized membrane protein HdeD (DUF308 family)